MNKTRKRSFTVLLFVLASLFVLVLSLGIFSACDSSESMDVNESNTANSGPAWYYGDKAPAEDLGEEGDYYLNTETLASYVKDGKTWREAVSGETGASWYYGTSAPNANLGVEHDFYLNTSTGELYQKGADSWGMPLLTLKGTAGRDGVVWFSGDKAPEKDDPALRDAHNGDFYLNNSTFDVYQLKADGTWDHLGSIKGNPGKDAENPIQFYDGDGTPYTEENQTKLAGAKEGDLYIGVFDGMDGNGMGSRLYRKVGGEWVVLMESIKAKQAAIHNIEELKAFAEIVNGGSDFAGIEVHLKDNITFPASETARGRRSVELIDAADDWTPIGTAEHPFKGTFDGEGHVIENFSAKTTDDAKTAGFFGYVENATIEHLHFVKAEVTASGEGSVGAVVVGQAKSGVTVKDVTVTGNSTVTAQSSATTGSLVGKSDGAVTVESVEVEVTGSGEHAGGNEKQDLVGSGNVTFQGENNAVSYPVVDGVYGFVEKHILGTTGEVESTIYEISTLDGLKAFRDSVNGTLESGEKPNNYSGKDVVLVADIDLKNEAWLPIGCYKRAIEGQSNKEQLPFEGNFDGGNHTISNLRMYAIEDGMGGDNYYGLFGLTKKPMEGTQEIKNLTIINVDMPAPKNYDPDDPYTWHGNHNNVGYIGALVGVATGTSFSNVHLKGEIYLRANSNVGGLIGVLEPDTTSVLSDLSVEGDGVIWATKTAGGIIGSVNYSLSGAGTLELNNIKVSGVVVHAQTMFIGGVVGELATSSSSKTIAVTIDGVQLDGVRVQPYNISSDNAKKTVGVVVGGYGKEVTSVTIKNVTGTAIVENDPDRPNDAHATMLNGGIIGKNTGNEAEPHVTIEGCDELVVIWYGVTRDDAKKEVHVYSAEGLKWLRDEINAWKPNGNQPFGKKSFADWTAYIEADIDLNNEEWIPIGNINTEGDVSFGGTFDGKGHKIQNLKISKGYDKGTGFFARVINSAVIRDVIFENAEVLVDVGYTGVVVGRAGSSGNPSLKNITLQGTIHVSGTSYVGAVVGHMGAIADTITVKADEGSYVHGSNDVGGIAGATRAGGGVCRYSNLTTNIAVEATLHSAGGIVGWEQGGNVYENCTATGTLSATSGAANACFGSVVNEATTVDHFTYTGEITGGTVTGFYYNNGADAKFTNSTATVTYGGVTTVYTADASGNVTTA